MTSLNRLLIIDDEENMRHLLATITSKAGFEVTVAEDGMQGLEFHQQQPFDFVLCDLKMPRMDGLQFLKKSQTYNASTTIIMMSAYAGIDDAVAAMKEGAYDFITKPFKTDAILISLKKAKERQLLLNENKQLKSKIDELETHTHGRDIVATSTKMVELLDFTARVAKYESTTVLITGESGTGKELIAKSIHSLSQRARGPFIAINCGSIPENLLESEFFGYRKGSFTGADTNRKGLFESAQNGTIFLDEIGELPLNLQVKMLRVLQENEIQRIGATRPTKINSRVIAATAKNLMAEVANGTFREDLYYRLNVVTIDIPPLRDRKEDIPVLCNHFIKKLNSRLGLSIKKVNNNAMPDLLQHSWPGNVRELENTLERAAIFSDTDHISAANLTSAMTDNRGTPAETTFQSLSLKKNKAIMEKQLIQGALIATKNNKSQAAKLLEISYPALLNKIKEYKVLKI